MPSSSARLNEHHRFELLDTARRSVHAVVRRGAAVSQLCDNSSSGPLAEPRASFVTLTINGRLRGCCGHLEAREPLILAVWRSAGAAACRDHRFSPVARAELRELCYEIAALGPLVQITARDEHELLSTIETERTGLVLRLHDREATYLPKVWEGLPHPQAFVAGLKEKAGLDHNFWSNEMQWYRYEVESFSGRDTDITRGVARNESA